MLKKISVIGVVVLLIASFAFASNPAVKSATDDTYLSHVSTTPRGPVVNELDEDIWIDRTIDGQWDYFFSSFAQFDTMATHFLPLAPCIVKEAEVCFAEYTGPAEIEAYVWEYSAEAEALWPLGRAPWRGTTDVSPLGPVLVGPYTHTPVIPEGADDTNPTWMSLIPEGEFPVDGITVGDPDTGIPAAFIVGFVKMEDIWNPDAGEYIMPNPRGDDCDVRGYNNFWCGGPWNPEETPWGSYSVDPAHGHSEMLLRVRIEYAWGVPPIIGGLSSLPNTVNLEKECAVSVTITDDVPWSEDHHAYLNVAINEDPPTEFEIFDDDDDSKFEATFNLTDYNVVVGDVVSYWARAVDEEDSENIGDPADFEIIEFVNPGASVLIIDDGIFLPDVVTGYFDANYPDYELYSTGANKGIDKYAVMQGWSTVFVAGWGCGTVPTRGYGTDAYSDFLLAGGDLVLCDQDYFYVHEGGEDLTFAPGDFAYDFLGIAAGTNDPWWDEGEICDTSFYGEPDHIISGAWADDPFFSNPVGILYSWGGITSRYHWYDGLEPTGDAEVLFIGTDNAEINAIMRGDDPENESVTITFGFAPQWSCPVEEDTVNYNAPSAQLIALFDAILDFLSPTSSSVPDAEMNIPSQFELSQNYPNPFNPTTSIAFSVPVADNVSLTVFNITGREVATLYNGFMKPGVKSITFDASDLASGIYFYRLEAGTYNVTRKMVLLK